MYRLKARCDIETDAIADRVQQRRRKSRDEQKRRKYRKWLLEFRRKHPSSTRTEILASSGGAGNWLLRNDREWLEKNMPPMVAVDWPTRDAELLAEIEALAEEIRSLHPPVRVSKNQLVERASHGWCLQKKAGAVPNSMRRMAELVESPSEFDARRLAAGEA